MTVAPTSDKGIILENLFDLLGFKPHSKAQWEVCRSEVRFNIFCCGRRWGKSQAAGRRLTKKMFVPDSINWIVGPTYRLGEKEFRVVYKDFEKLGLLNKCRKSYSVKQGDMRIQTPWNSILEVVSSERPESLLGEGLDHACMSETARHTRNTWEQYIEPALSDKRGSCDFPSTPRGYNWYHGLFRLGEDTAHPDYRSWQLPSWTNTARFPGGKSDIEMMRIRATASKQYFDQEYGAQFTSFAGQIYDEWNDLLNVVPITYNPKWQNFLALDYGFANPFVCLDIMVDPSDKFYVWREYHSRFQSTFVHGNYLANERPNPEGYHVDGMFGDPRGADEAATLALSLGYVYSQDMPWKQGVEAVKRQLKVQPDGLPGAYFDPTCINTIRSVSQLHVKERSARVNEINLEERTGQGNIQHKVDDHEADALRYWAGPYYVLGAGSHLSDIYGNEYAGSESDDFFRLHTNEVLDVDAYTF